MRVTQWNQATMQTRLSPVFFMPFMNALAGKEFVVGACIAGASMFCGITFANCMGVAIPLVCARLRIGPALASGPFVTTINDITTVVIYMPIATLMLQALSS